MIHDDSLGLSQILDASLQDPGRPSDERGRIQADQRDPVVLAVLKSGTEERLVERYRPFDTGHAAHLLDCGVREGLDLFHLGGVGIRHPDLSIHVGDA